MRRAALPKLRAYAALAVVGLLAAIVLGRPELVSLAAPFVLFLSIGLARLPAQHVAVELSLGRTVAVEGEDLDLTLTLGSETGIERLELEPVLPFGLELKQDPPQTMHLGLDESRAIPLGILCRRWGAYRLGAVRLRAFDRFGLVVDEARIEPALALRVYPSAERLRRLIDPVETQPYTGNQVARVKGDGVEFADIRQFSPGDQVRRINWRTSARRQTLHVNESHPERNADVVLFVDSFAEARRAGEGTLDRAVRATTALATAYLERRDRVGLVSFGGIVRWLTPAGGSEQLYRIVETLLKTEVHFSYAWRKIDTVPSHTLPPQSLVIALTPLLDERTIDALLDLRRRGFDLAIVDVSPLEYAVGEDDSLGELSLRVWRLWRDALRYRYECLGVPVVEWREGMPLVPALEGVRSFRRYARAVHA
jgi:uncharacterized protein (DUF58 family)